MFEVVTIIFAWILSVLAVGFVFAAGTCCVLVGMMERRGMPSVFDDEPDEGSDVEGHSEGTEYE